MLPSCTPTLYLCNGKQGIPGRPTMFNPLKTVIRMVNHLWRVTAIKVTGKVTPGMWVEVLKSGTNAQPTIKEIGVEFERKYGIALVGGCSLVNFRIEKMG